MIFWGRTNIQVQNFFGSNKFQGKRNFFQCPQKIVTVQKNFVQNFLGPNKFLVQKCLGSKNFGSTNFGVRKLFGFESKKIFLQKNFGTKKFLVSKNKFLG